MQPTEELVADMLTTDGAACAGLLAGIEAGAFADEAAGAAEPTSPVAVLRGEPQQLISLDCLRGTCRRSSAVRIPGPPARP